MRVYISGIVRSVAGGHEQEYRDRIGNALISRYREVTIVSPEIGHIDSSSDNKTEEALFFRQIQNALMSDLVIAYLPAASMGSAIEMWEAYKNSKPVYIISPLDMNWAVRFLSVRVFPDLDSFVAFINEGGLDREVRDRYYSGNGKK